VTNPINKFKLIKLGYTCWAKQVGQCMLGRVSWAVHGGLVDFKRAILLNPAYSYVHLIMFKRLAFECCLQWPYYKQLKDQLFVPLIDV
jgi:hypothetical protein